MKFKTEEEIIENEVEKKEVKEEKCPIKQALDIAFAQIDLINSMISSLRATIENLDRLYEEHNPR